MKPPLGHLPARLNAIEAVAEGASSISVTFRSGKKGMEAGAEAGFQVFAEQTGVNFQRILVIFLALERTLYLHTG